MHCNNTEATSGAPFATHTLRVHMRTKAGDCVQGVCGVCWTTRNAGSEEGPRQGKAWAHLETGVGIVQKAHYSVHYPKSLFDSASPLLPNLD